MAADEIERLQLPTASRYCALRCGVVREGVVRVAGERRTLNFKRGIQG